MSHLIVGGTKVFLKMGNIADEETEAIVNAANSSLLGGGGVDGAIHQKAGDELDRHCAYLYTKEGGGKTGESFITKAGRLKASWVIHTVGPIWINGNRGEEQLLEKAYFSSLNLAIQKGIKSIAIPSISTGAYGFPIKRASIIALRITLIFLSIKRGLERVNFVLFSQEDLDVYLLSIKKFQ